MSGVAPSAGRPSIVCGACKIRHRKCDWDEQTCKECKSLGLDCVRPSTFRFRYDAHQKKVARNFRSWEDGPGGKGVRLRFYDELPGLHAIYDGWETVRSMLPPMTAQDHGPGLPAPLVKHTELSYCQAAMNSDTSPVTNTTLSPRAQTARQPGFTPIEACLVRHFTNHMALWTDNDDPYRHFELEVPRRALSEPLLKYALCAFSARHFYRNAPNKDAEAESLHYQSKCLELLIPALSGKHPIDDVILTAVALLRQNEEMDETDQRFHLSGATKILNSIPDFATSGGLAEAACWLCLRENIYVSLTTQVPLTIAPDSFLQAIRIMREDEYSHCHRMVLHLAFLLNRTFAQPLKENDLAVSEAEIAEWDLLKPDSYYPTLTIPPSRAEGRIFPEIWTLAPHHTIGLQYFHIAQIVLIVAKQLHRPDHIGAGKPFDSLGADRKRERQIREHLLTIVGLAVSNPKAENTLFTASHCLSVWADCLRRKDDQHAALVFLESMGAKTGWRTSRLISRLRSEWREGSESG